MLMFLLFVKTATRDSESGFTRWCYLSVFSVNLSVAKMRTET